MLKISKATYEDILDVWYNMRERDRFELTQVMHYDDKMMMEHADTAHCYVAFKEDEPIAAFGFDPFGGATVAWLIATPAINNHWIEATRLGKRFLKTFEDLHYPNTMTVLVWEKHLDSIAWLKLLGFKPTGVELKQKKQILKQYVR